MMTVRSKKKSSKTTDGVLDALLSAQKKTKNFARWRQLQAIWLRERLQLSGPHVARSLNYRLQTVHALWHKWLDRGMKMFLDRNRRGGRHNAYLTVEQEKEFLRPFLKKAEDGGALEMQEIKKEFEKQVGRSVSTSTIYRLLNRHRGRRNEPGRGLGKGVDRHCGIGCGKPPKGMTQARKEGYMRAQNHLDIMKLDHRPTSTNTVSEGTVGKEMSR